MFCIILKLIRRVHFLYLARHANIVLSNLHMACTTASPVWSWTPSVNLAKAALAWSRASVRVLPVYTGRPLAL